MPWANATDTDEICTSHGRSGDLENVCVGAEQFDDGTSVSPPL